MEPAAKRTRLSQATLESCPKDSALYEAILSAQKADLEIQYTRDREEWMHKRNAEVEAADNELWDLTYESPEERQNRISLEKLEHLKSMRSAEDYYAMAELGIYLPYNPCWETQ